MGTRLGWGRDSDGDATRMGTRLGWGRDSDGEAPPSRDPPALSGSSDEGLLQVRESWGDSDGAVNHWHQARVAWCWDADRHGEQGWGAVRDWGGTGRFWSQAGGTG
jgi:hypothetical protein